MDPEAEFEYNASADKYINPGSGKGRSKKESEQNTNRTDPGGDTRKLVTKFKNTEKNHRERKNSLTLDNSIFDISHESGELMINQDTILDKVLVSNKVNGLDNIYGNSHFSASTPKTLRNENQGAQISLMDDRLIMKGKHLFMIDDDSNSYKEPLSLKALNKAIVLPGTTSLNSPNGIRNVKRIRSPTNDGLEIESNSNLIISGNLGVKIFGVKLLIDSNDMRIHSRDSDILVVSHSGVLLPFLPQSSHNVAKSQMSKNIPETTSLLSLFQLCICRNGKMFKIPKRDETESCSDARFPISANPCL